MKPHRSDGVSLSFGVLFLLVVAWWAVSRVVTVHLPAVGWLVAGGLIVFGVLGLLGALRSARRTPVAAPAPEQPAEPELPGGLSPEVHASIVRELLDPELVDDRGDRLAQPHPGRPSEQPGKD